MFKIKKYRYLIMNEQKEIWETNSERREKSMNNDNN